MTTTPDTTTPAGGEPVRTTTTTIVYVTAQGVPDAWVNGTEIEVHVTPPNSAVEAVVLVPIDQALVWAADIYAAVVTAVEEHLGGTLDEHELVATLPDPGRLVYERLAHRWTDPPPQAAAS